VDHLPLQVTRDTLSVSYQFFTICRGNTLSKYKVYFEVAQKDIEKAKKLGAEWDAEKEDVLHGNNVSWKYLQIKLYIIEKTRKKIFK
jgi:hypothetical protein